MSGQFFQESTIDCFWKSTWWNNDIFAASIAILLCHGILRSWKEPHWKVQSEKSTVASHRGAYDPLHSTPTAKERLNLSSRLALVVDQAIQLPLIAAYHPAAVHPSIRNVSSPNAVQILLQILILIVVENICRSWIDRFLSAVLDADTDKDGGTVQDLAAEYTIPKATLILAMTITNIPLARVTSCSGNLHLAAVILWAASRQWWQWEK